MLGGHIGSDFSGFGVRCGGGGGGAHHGPTAVGVAGCGYAEGPETRLQEALQAHGLAVPVYTLTAATGDPHLQSFTVSCEVPVFWHIRRGRGRQPAARRAVGRRENAGAAAAPNSEARMSDLKFRAGHVAIVGRPKSASRPWSMPWWGARCPSSPPSRKPRGIGSWASSIARRLNWCWSTRPVCTSRRAA